MTKTHIILMWAATGLMLLSACGQQHQAEALADDYLEQNARQLDKMQHCRFLPLDSTTLVTDSAVAALRAYDHPRMKQTGEPGVPATAGRILYVLPMRYYYDGEQERVTFYIDEQMQHIVAVR
ncbi:MAG: hypothetical protein K5928_06980 [Prevotella sp.]|nr:hypothetical protein [Prevotella sp.]